MSALPFPLATLLITVNDGQSSLGDLDCSVGGVAVHQDDFEDLDGHTLEDVGQIVRLVQSGENNADGDQ